MILDHELRKSLSIKFTSDERAYLETQSAKAGLPLSTYCHNVVMGYAVRDNFPRSQVAAELCKHHVMVEQHIKDESLKKLFHEWEVQVWQRIK